MRNLIVILGICGFLLPSAAPASASQRLYEGPSERSGSFVDFEIFPLGGRGIQLSSAELTFNTVHSAPLDGMTVCRYIVFNPEPEAQDIALLLMRVGNDFYPAEFRLNEQAHCCDRYLLPDVGAPYSYERVYDPDFRDRTPFKGFNSPERGIRYYLWNVTLESGGNTVEVRYPFGLQQLSDWQPSVNINDFRTARTQWESYPESNVYLELSPFEPYLVASNLDFSETELGKYSAKNVQDNEIFFDLSAQREPIPAKESFNWFSIVLIAMLSLSVVFLTAALVSYFRDKRGGKRGTRT